MGKHSAGVAPEYAAALGKDANRQPLVSLTLAKTRKPRSAQSAGLPRPLPGSRPPRRHWKPVSPS